MNTTRAEIATAGPRAQTKANRGEQALQLRADGLSFAQMARAMDVTPATAHKWYTRARAEQLARVEDLREKCFFDDLGRIEDMLSDLESRLDYDLDDWRDRFAAVVKLLEVKAKMLGYASLTLTPSDSAKSKSELVNEIRAQVHVMGARAGVVIDVE